KGLLHKASGRLRRNLGGNELRDSGRNPTGTSLRPSLPQLRTSQAGQRPEVLRLLGQEARRALHQRKVLSLLRHSAARRGEGQELVRVPLQSQPLGFQAKRPAVLLGNDWSARRPTRAHSEWPECLLV
nr:hypothetical protein [Tanacetum cinerariifolium]